MNKFLVKTGISSHSSKKQWSLILYFDLFGEHMGPLSIKKKSWSYWGKTAGIHWKKEAYGLKKDFQ